jgi:hypothetical protein
VESSSAQSEGAKISSEPPEVVWRLSTVHLLGALILLIVTSPFVMELPQGRVIESALLTLVLLSAVLAVRGRRRTLIAACALVVPAVLSNWLWHVLPDIATRELSLVAGIVFVVFVIVQLLRFILQAPRVNADVFAAAVSTYLLLGLVWSFAYTLVGRRTPGAFIFTVNPDSNRAMAGFEALYFSFATLTSVGYGDIVPVANVARMLAMTEAITGVFYLALLVARLVGLHASKQPDEPREA